MSELRLNTDGHIIKFGADNDVSLTHVADTGLLINSTRQLQFNDASQNINAPSATVLDINATDEIELNATLVDINANVEISGTATTTGVHTFSATPVFPDGSLALADLDIDGGTDIGAAIVDADLFIVDDGAGGTNRKVTASRIKTYVGGAALANDANNRVVTADGSGGINGEANLTFDGTALTANKVILTNSSGLTGGASSDGFITNADDTNTGIVFPDSDRIQFWTNDAEQVRITSAGCVGIGTAGDATKLKVQTTTANEKIMQLRHGDGGTAQEGFQIQYYGEAPNGTGNSFITCEDTAATRFKVASDGDVTNTGNSYGATSDERIKQNITDASSQWDDIKALKIRSYKLKSDTTKTNIGVVAQELETSGMNGLVTESDPSRGDILIDSSFGTLVDDTDNPLTFYEDGDVIPEGKKIGDGKTFPKKVGEIKTQVKGVKYSVLYMKAIKALQEAITKIESLEARVTTLEG